MQKSNCNPNDYNAVINFNSLFDPDFDLSPNAKLFGIVFENLIGDNHIFLLNYDYFAKVLNMTKGKLYKAINEYLEKSLYFKFKIMINSKTYTYIYDDYYFSVIKKDEIDLEKLLTIQTIKMLGD